MNIESLPLSIRNSKILSDKERELLATVIEIPEITPSFEDAHVKQIVQYYSISPDEMEKELHFYAQQLLSEGKINEAWQVLLCS